MGEIIDVLITEKMISLVGLSHVKTLLKDLKGEEPTKCKQPLMQQEPSKWSRRVKEKAMRDEEEYVEEMEVEKWKKNNKELVHNPNL